MFRVITKSLVVRPDGRRRQVDKGPWQPTEERARAWADFLLATGLYETVVVQSNGQDGVTQASHMVH